MEKTVNSVPSAHEDRAELLEQRALAAAAAKDAGNQSLKDGDVDEAVACYSMAIRFDGTNHIFYSNRSAAYQTKKLWREAASDAEQVVKLNPQFPKGYLHWARSLMQQHKFKDALGVVEKAKTELTKCGELAGVQTQLAEISAQITAGLSPGGRRMPDASDATRAEAFKKKGNESYKEGEYQDAVRFYSQVKCRSCSFGAEGEGDCTNWVATHRLAFPARVPRVPARRSRRCRARGRTTATARRRGPC